MKLKYKFNKVKRRIELGVDKPGDQELLLEMGTKLGYKPQYLQIKKK